MILTVTGTTPIQKAVELINHRPRKCLDYRTSFEVFYELSSDIDALHF
jgi:IS30 family transposase